jgi:hypothetical protein
MSSSTTRIHLTGAHQMRVIHPNRVSDYTSRHRHRHHPCLSLDANLPCSIIAHAQDLWTY